MRCNLKAPRFGSGRKLPRGRMLPPGLTEEFPPAMPSMDHVTPVFTRPLNDGAELLGLHNGQRGEVGTELLPLPRTGLGPRVLSQNRDFPRR